MSMTHEKNVLKSENLETVFADLQSCVRMAAENGWAMHEIEREVWRRLLQLGRAALSQVFALVGTGDVGETLTLSDGEKCRRLPETHQRRYVSIFGEFRLARVVYGSREGQKIECVPLDNRLQLPGNDFSYLLQDWDQSLCVEQAFGQARTTVARILGLTQSVDSLEHMNQEMAELATTFVLNQPTPKEEGEVLVLSADQKGIVMRRPADAPAPKAHRTKGDKASRKRMATVGTVYSVDRYRRTPEEVVAALFHDRSEPSTRPQPQHKDVWASLPRDDVPGSGTQAVFAWMVGELYLRGRRKAKPLVFLSDGQEALWEARAEWLPEGTVGILDLLHVTPRLWKAAHVFHKEGSRHAEKFVRARLVRVLQGKASRVIRGLREMATKRRLTGTRKRALTEVCRYLKQNLPRMHYDEYLAAGYPIASGAVEGACRHLVKDRMERAGMHWTIPGAQAMLDVRSIYVSGHWDEYQAYRIDRETDRLYPERTSVNKALKVAA
jgi:hypothetical protein